MRYLLAVLSLALLSTVSHAQQKAFPTAEGYGQFTVGGRGGVVYLVTNTLDAGPGSLRACVEAMGPRTCLIRTSGNINPGTEMRIINPFISILGQTAKGQGVQILQGTNKRNAIFIDTDNVIIRHIKFRMGPVTSPPSDIPNCFYVGGSFKGARDVIIDHVSCAWATDQLLAVNPPTDRITIQNSLFYEGLNFSTHTQGAHSKGPNFRSTGVSFIRNLIANNVIRNPNIVGGMCIPGSIRQSCNELASDYEVRDNVIFNGQEALADWWNGRGLTELNFVGNVIIRGPSTKSKLNSNATHGIYALDAWDFAGRWPPNVSGTSDPMNLCIQDNISTPDYGGLPTQAGGITTPPAIHGVLNPNDSHLVRSTNCYTAPVGRGMTAPSLGSANVLANVLANAGALPFKTGTAPPNSQPNRDTADARLISEVSANPRIGKIIDHPDEVGGYPVMLGGGTYTDALPTGAPDGMGDAWANSKGIAHGDINGDHDSDGYTNLEEFVNSRIGE